MRIVWSAEAVANLQEITVYIRQFRPRSAQRIHQEIRNAVRRLTRFPLSGRVVPEFPTDRYREIIVRDYRVLYRIADDRIRIVAVVHGRRDLTSVWPLEDA